MNERIRELAEQAIDYVADAIELGFPKDQVDEIRAEKFAELMVTEFNNCIDESIKSCSITTFDEKYLKMVESSLKENLQSKFG
jgi:hypothetical protein